MAMESKYKIVGIAVGQFTSITSSFPNRAISLSMNSIQLMIYRSLLRGNHVPSPLEGEGKGEGDKASFLRYPAAWRAGRFITPAARPRAT